MFIIKQTTKRKIISIVMVLIMAIIFSTTTDYFFSWSNVCSIFREVSVIGLIAIGTTFVIIGGGIDLSTGAILGLSAMIASRLVNDTLLPIWLIVLISLMAGITCGLINGLLVVKFKLSEFIATFSTAFVFRGIVYIIAFRENGNLVTKVINDPTFKMIGGDINQFYYMSFVWIIAILISYLVLKNTKLGVYIYAIGTNQKSALFSGVKVGEIKLITFAISGFCSALAGIFLLAWQNSVALDSGSGMEFLSIAAIVVGGVALEGGRGDTISTAIGSIFMIIVVNGIYKYGLPTEVQTITYGAVIIIASVFDRMYFTLMKNRHVIIKKKEAGTNGGMV